MNYDCFWNEDNRVNQKIIVYESEQVNGRFLFICLLYFVRQPIVADIVFNALVVRVVVYRCIEESSISGFVVHLKKHGAAKYF